MIYHSKKKRALGLIAAISLSMTMVVGAASCAATPTASSNVNAGTSQSGTTTKDPSYSDVKVEDGMQTYYQLPAVEKGKFDDYYTTVLYFPNSGAHRESTDNYRPFEETEWAVTYKTEPRFEGHHQPNEPAWGYTNCSDPKVMAQEVSAMVEYGIDCVTFDWYWGKERRLNNTGMRRDGTDGMYFSEELEYGFLRAENRNDIDFSIMWCNEAASLGCSDANQDKEEWDIMTDYIIANYFTQPNFARYEGKLVFTIYTMTNFVTQIRGEYGQTDVRLVKQALDEFRQKTRDAGLGELYIQTLDSRALMADDAVFNLLSGGGELIGDDGKVYTWANWDKYTACEYVGIDSCVNYFFPTTNVEETIVDCYSPEDNGATIDMADVVDASFRVLDENGDGVEDVKYKAWENVGIDYQTGFNSGLDVTPRVTNSAAWDHTKSYPHGVVMVNSTPYNYQQGLLECRKLADKYNDNRIGLGAWNEWGEGAFLKPDTLYGYGRLRAVKNVFGA